VKRRLWVFGIVVAATVSGTWAPHAQTPATTQRLWTGTWEEHDAWAGSGRVGRSQAQITYDYVQGPDEFGGLRWASRRLTWSAVWEENRYDYVALWKRPADDRGFTMQRYREDSVTVCTSRGKLELGPAVAGSGDDLTPAQKARLLASCETTYRPRESGVPTPPPTTTETRELLQVLGMPNDDELTGCAYEKTWPKGGRPAGSFSVSVSAPTTALMEVDPKGEYGRFVPVPGQTLTFTASVPAGMARFRFELDPEATSHFPGYATNANVDEAFFVKYKLAHLADAYANDGPDFMFDRERLSGQEWSRIEPLVVETRIAQSGAVVSVTAMDYGAVGTLRAFVKSEGCGDWLPVPVRFGSETRDAVTIPMDEDYNLMADALEKYRGLDSGVDADAEPKGNGMAGDGLTAFEEYRGFLIADLDESSDPSTGGMAQRLRDSYDEVYAAPIGEPEATGYCNPDREWHVRTPPHHKNLFVLPDGPLLAHMITWGFGWASDLSVHVVCDFRLHPGDPAIRTIATYDPSRGVINFTLQLRGLRTWQGKTVSQEEPQHGVFVTQFSGVTSGRSTSVGVAPVVLGPPKLTAQIYVQTSLGFRDMLNGVAHELGHAVGVPHHGDSVVDWRLTCGAGNITALTSPVQRSDGQACLANTFEITDVVMTGDVEKCGPTGDLELFSMYENGRFVGCSGRIVRRGQQNSGDVFCPMRYVYEPDDWYEPSGASARYERTASLRTKYGGGALADIWSGRFLRARWGTDYPHLGKFCLSPAGTKLNRGGDHAGDNGRSHTCSEFIVVNDLAARGVPQ
jgi:hypothetical protein